MARGKAKVEAPVEETVSDEATYDPGMSIRFIGYGDDVPEDEQVLEEGEIYVIEDVNEQEGTVAVKIDNPNFNPKKRASEDNSKEIIIDLFFEEVEPAGDVEESADDEEVGDDEEEVPAAKAKPAAKGKSVAKATPAAKPAAKGKATQAAKPAAKAKSAAKGKPAAKGKQVAKADTDEDQDDIEALEAEDQDVLQLVEDNRDDLVSLANELLEESAGIDYRLGGVLYHIRLNKEYKELDARYAEKQGFQLFVSEQLNVEYRKAMYLIDIYYKFNKYGIPAEKVQEIGWTKASKIAAVMTDSNAEELVELAEENSVSDLNDTLKESYSKVGGERAEVRKKVKFTFRLFEDSGKSVETILLAAQQQRGFKTLDDTFEFIVTEWGAEHVQTAKTGRGKAGVKPSAHKGSVHAKA